MRSATFILCILVANDCHAAIRGTVIDSTSGAPIPGAAVRLLSPGEDDAVAEASSNAEGQFAFNDVDKSAYVLFAAKSGYVDRFPELIGRDGASLVLPLTKCGAITGRILDASGRPVRSARILAAAYRGEGRTPRPDPGGPFSPVDDLGNYRLYDLAPGKYWIVAIPGRGASGKLLAPLYFPGTSRLDKATPITLHAGETRDSVDVTVFETAGYPVSGRVTGLPADASQRQIALSLFSAAGYSVPLQTAATGDDGRFRFENVPEGSYEIVAAGPAMGRAAFGPLLGRDPLYGRVHLDVVSQEVTNIDVPLSKGFALDGQVAFAVRGEDDPNCYSGASVSIEPLSPVPFSPLPAAPIDGQGRFHFSALPPARYHVAANGIRSGCFFQELRVGSQLVENQTVELNGAGRLELILTKRSSRLEGMVQDDTHSPASIVLVPEDPFAGVEPQKARFAVADAEGRYHFEQLGPGRYRAIAVPSSKVEPLSDPAFWLDHRDLTTAVALKPGASCAPGPQARRSLGGTSMRIAIAVLGAAALLSQTPRRRSRRFRAQSPMPQLTSPSAM